MEFRLPHLTTIVQDTAYCFSMLVHFFLCRLAPLHLLVAQGLIPPAQTEQLARRQSSSDGYNKHGSQAWAGRVEENEEVIRQEPIAVRKMMDNESEMFFQEYWQFDEETDDWDALQSEPEESRLRTSDLHEVTSAADAWSNASMVLPFQAPFALHRDTETTPFYSHWARGLFPLLHERAFSCPNGTNACTGLNRPNSCCPFGSTCQLVTDTGQGDVACCGSGQTCAGNVQDCAVGYASCPSAAGGGCCIRDYACVGTIGCKSSSLCRVAD